jgi:hypothetical protein
MGGGELVLNTNVRYSLTSHIPIIPDKLTEELSINSIIGIHSGNMLSANGENINKRFLEKGIPDALNLSEKTKFLLQFYVKDRTLEGFWDNRQNIYNQLANFNWHIIIAPNFSVYEDSPRIDHLYNMKRSSIVYNELLNLGLPAVPDISWYNQIDLDQWVREINKNKLKTIAFSFQVVNVRLKASNIWKHYLMGFKYLCQQIEDDIQIIIVGVVSPKRLKHIKEAAGLNEIIVLNQTAYLQSRRGIYSETGMKAPSELSKNDIFIKNLEYYDTEYKRLN